MWKKVEIQIFPADCSGADINDLSSIMIFMLNRVMWHLYKAVEFYSPSNAAVFKSCFEDIKNCIIDNIRRHFMVDKPVRTKLRFVRVYVNSSGGETLVQPVLKYTYHFERWSMSTVPYVDLWIGLKSTLINGFTQFVEFGLNEDITEMLRDEQFRFEEMLQEQEEILKNIPALGFDKNPDAEIIQKAEFIVLPKPCVHGQRRFFR